MKTHRNRCRPLLLALLLLSSTDAYTSRRKKTVNISPSESTIASPHKPLQSDAIHDATNQVPRDEEHRRLSEKPNTETPEAAAVKDAVAAGDLKPTIQQLKGTIVKDDMNRGPPLASESICLVQKLV